MLKSVLGRDPSRGVETCHLDNDILKGLVDILPHGKGFSWVIGCEFLGHSQNKVVPPSRIVIQMLEEAD